MFQYTLESISEGSITFAEFYKLSNNQATLFSLLEVMNFDLTDKIKLNYDLRLMQLNHFNRARDVVNYTLQLCKQLLPKTGKLEF